MSSELSTWALEANVILRYLLHDHDTLSPRALSIMQSLHDGDLILLLDPVTLAEVVFVMSSVYDVSNADIAHALVPLLQQPGLRLEEKDRYLQALYLFAGPVRHFGDACACATALLESSGKLLSFDRKLSRVEGIQREEGFPAP